MYLGGPYDEALLGVGHHALDVGPARHGPEPAVGVAVGDGAPGAQLAAHGMWVGHALGSGGIEIV
jgi:hypothetical protein